MTSPMASQTTKRTSVTRGRLTISTSEAMIEMSDFLLVT
jgi:hypothetical protein